MGQTGSRIYFILTKVVRFYFAPQNKLWLVNKPLERVFRKKNKIMTNFQLVSNNNPKNIYWWMVEANSTFRLLRTFNLSIFWIGSSEAEQRAFNPRDEISKFSRSSLK